MNVSLNNDNAQNVYYNFNVRKGVNDIYTYIATSDTRTHAIIDNPCDYEIAVARFSLPTNALPVFVWKGDTYFEIAYTFGATTIKKYLIFTPNTTGNDLYGNTIWTYQHFIDIINNALRDGFTDLKTAEPLCPATEPAFLSYTATTQLLVWNVEQAYGTTTKVYFNQNLFFLVPSFQAFGTTLGGVKFWEVISKNNGNNSTVIDGTNYYSTKQEYPTVFLWKDFKTMIFETDNIPVDSEYTMAQENDYRHVLTDFEASQGELQEKQIVQYYPRADFRWYDLISCKQLRTMDLKVYWADKTGKPYLFYLDVDDIFTMKLYLRKKIK